MFNIFLILNTPPQVGAYTFYALDLPQIYSILEQWIDFVSIFANWIIQVDKTCSNAPQLLSDEITNFFYLLHSLMKH